MSTRSPDFDLTVWNKETNAKGRVGAAWVNEDNSISIVLNPCVVLVPDKNINIRLFKARDATKGIIRPAPTLGEKLAQGRQNAPIDQDTSIPF